MKNKFLIGTLTVFAAICTSILLLNISKSESVKDNYFERKFSKNEFLKFNKEYKRLDENSKYELVYSKADIIEGLQILQKNKLVLDLKISDFGFSKTSQEKILLPENANIILIDNKNIFYFLNAKLNVMSLLTKKINILDVKKIDVSYLISLENSSSKYLFIGEIFQDNVYKNGFFILDIFTGTIKPSHILKTTKESLKNELLTMYSGSFQKLNNEFISYTCDKMSTIFLFKNKGVFESKFITNDKTLPPKIIRNLKGDCYYSNDGLKNTNVGIFTNKKNVFVFAMTSPISDKIIIDQYSRITFRYVQSFLINYKNFCSNDIQNVFIENDNIILKLNFNYASFKFSRYNE